MHVRFSFFFFFLGGGGGGRGGELHYVSLEVNTPTGTQIWRTPCVFMQFEAHTCVAGYFVTFSQS